jgi:hypothetical protein
MSGPGAFYEPMSISFEVLLCETYLKRGLATSTLCQWRRMCRVSTQTTGNSASARAPQSHCDSGPASSPIRLKRYMGFPRTPSAVRAGRARTQSLERDAGQTVRSRTQQGSYSSAGCGACGKRPRGARCGFRHRHRSQHALVGQLDPSERRTADHRLVQQRRRRHCPWPGQRHPGAGPFASGHRTLRRRRFQHGDVRIPHRRAAQAAGESGSL